MDISRLKAVLGGVEGPHRRDRRSPRTLPWNAAGYQFGEVVSSVRVYTMFPF